MKARDLMLFAILANAGQAFAYLPPATFGPEAIQQPSGGAPSAQGDQKKAGKKGKKGEKGAKKEGKKGKKGDKDKKD